jgi:hypothetical protein
MTNSKITPYCCIRCGYETDRKSSMIDHLYKKKKMCPAVKNLIELTDAIKKHIIENRIYIIPKKIILKPKTIEVYNENHFIYLIRPKENAGHNENVYKLGKTISRELTVNISRLTSYGKGSELIFISQCDNCHEFERFLLNKFEEKFDKYQYGNEYFIGDKYEMILIIMENYKKILKIEN